MHCLWNSKKTSNNKANIIKPTSFPHTWISLGLLAPTKAVKFSLSSTKSSRTGAVMAWMSTAGFTG